MEELRLLVEMVAGLPAMTVWVLAGYLAYKLAIIGSIYSVIRFVTAQLFDWLKTKRGERVEIKNFQDTAESITVSAEADQMLKNTLRQVIGVSSVSRQYIHTADAQWLMDAVNEKRLRDVKAKAKTNV